VEAEAKKRIGVEDEAMMEARKKTAAEIAEERTRREIEGKMAGR
jgi:hypothetical protein